MIPGWPAPERLAIELDLAPAQAERVLRWVLAWTDTATLARSARLTMGTTFVLGDEEPDSASLPPFLDGEERYEDRGLLGRGGMGEVRRVYDRQLQRTIAMKVLHPEQGAGAHRFLEEARTIARLQHPGVLPVHEIGRLPDGRVYFTMQEIRGRTLRDHVHEVHAASGGDHWGTAAEGWTFRRLIDAFHGVCETMAYSHGEGLVHRDLKPRNVMVGAHNEVLVVDWGLARPRGSAPDGGAVAGTAAYLAPELLRDPPPEIDPRADVYALGGMLYNILTNQAPFEGDDASLVLAAVRRGPSPVPTSERPLPDELVELCVRAMAREPMTRLGHAGVLAAAVRTWLDGSRKRSQAEEMVLRARAILPEAAALRGQAARMEDGAAARLQQIPPWAPEADKHEAWASLDQARALRARADARESEAELVLQGALTVDPTLPEAHAELAARSVARHADAELRGDQAGAAAAMIHLRRHLDALPAHHERRFALRQYMRGEGFVTVHTEPAGAEVRARRVVERQRCLQLEAPELLGMSPVDEVGLGHGSWVLELTLPGREPVRYPVQVGRGERWTGAPPGQDLPQPIPLPAQGSLDADDCYVPAGWTWLGGDSVAFGSADRRRLWIDGFVLRRHPVTNREYLAFLDDLVVQGREEEALCFAPRERGGTLGQVGALIYGRDEAGGFHLGPDADGDLWGPDEPVFMVDWFCARAYAAWFAARTGQPWRLPSEWEWEKAARGVDERPYPWGQHFDPSRACTRLSHDGRPLPAVVGEFPADRSVYGVRGLGGNVRDWCLEPFQELPPPDGSRVQSSTGPESLTTPRVDRGGFWLGNDRDARSADRHSHMPTHRSAELGFRLARSWPPG